MAQDALTAQAEIARLKFQLARYRRAEFGRSSEKLAREAEQLELALEALESDQAERLATASPAVAAAVETAAEAQKPARRPLSPHLPREELRHPAPCTCPGCGGALRKIADEVTETLDYVPGRFKVVRHVREKLSCRACDTVVAAPAPDHAIARGRAGAGLLAHIVVSKYDDHLPLYRQAEIFAREGVNLETSTLSGWVGATAAALAPLIAALAAEVMASDTLHVDDTPVPVLAPGTGKTKTGRLWVYVRDERPFAGPCPPAALFFHSPDRKGDHPRSPSERVRRRHPCRRLCRVQRAVRREPHRRGRLLGPRQAQVLRRACRQRLPDREGGARTHWRALRDREADQRPRARSPPTRTSAEIETNRRGTGRLGRRDPAQAVAQVRTRRGLPLHAGALGRADALLRQRPARARQQPGRARVALRRDRPQELPLRRLPCWRPARRGA